MSDESHTGILMDNQSNSDKSDQSSEVMLKFKCDADEFIAFKVELKADKVEFKTREGNFQNMDEEDQNLKTRLNHSSKRNEKSSNIETCIFLKLSTPIIAYHQELDHYTERSFITEHNVELEFIRVENKVTELLGYLPQDLERRSFLKFIHPDDLNKIKQIHFDIYEGRERQNLEVYRWKCYNGYYVPVKTNWSWYIHPWKQRIDFIIGKHVILNEPLNINIFEKNIIKAESGLNIFTNENSNEHLKQTQKNIVDYISKKIPGMDDAAKLLGEDLVKLLKKKYLSASYCQEQNRLLKRNNKDKSFELKTSQQEFEYPQYYVPTHKILQFKPDYNRFVEPKLPFLSSKQNSDKKSHTTIPPIYQTSRPQNSKSSMPALNSNKHGKERKSAIRQLKEKDNQIEQPYSYLSNSDTVNVIFCLLGFFAIMS
jgi:PAS domain S-box-containing protein